VAQDAAQEERQRHLRHAVAGRHQGFEHRARDHRKLREPHFLANPQATEPQIRTIYEGFGLNSRQIEIVATAQPKRDYYYQSRLGNRLFDLDLGPATLAFAGASTPQDQRDIDRVLLDAGVPGFAGAWLRHRGLDWAADLLPSFPGLAPGSLADQPLENLP
jgi:type IV secretion system protein VirB4